MHQCDPNDLKYVQERGHQPVGWFPGAIDEKTGKINPQVSHFYLGDGKSVTVAHVKPVYYETLAGDWRPLSEITSYHGNKKLELNTDWRKAHPRFIDWLTKRQALLGKTLLLPSPFGYIPSKYQSLIRPTLNVGMTVSTYYPDPSVETTTVDGAVEYLNTSSSWASIHTATAGTHVFDAHTLLGPNRGIGVYHHDATRHDPTRVFLLFDTASIPDTDTISDATLSLYASAAYQRAVDTAYDYLAVVQSSPASNTALALGDFDQCGAVDNPTEGSGQFAITSWVNTQYNDFTLNATGISWISKTGVTKLGMRSGDDMQSTDPFSGNGYNVVNAYSADRASTTEDPKLVVTHAASATTTQLFTLLGVG